MKVSRLLPFTLGIAMCLTAASARAELPQYNVTVLLPPGSSNSSISAINNLGQVAVDGDTSSFIYSNGTYTAIPLIPGTTGRILSSAINDRGQVAGLQVDSGSRAILYSNGVTTDLGLGDDSQSSGINNSGQVVGVFNAGKSSFLYSNGVVDTLPTLGGDAVMALAINDRGQIVGGSNTSPGGPLHPFLYSGGSKIDLGVLPGFVSGVANGINQSGDVVGYLKEASNGSPFPPVAPFLYHDGAMTLLQLPDPSPNTQGAWAWSINDQGQIRGQFGNLADGEFLYADGQMYNLQAALGPNSPWDLTGPTQYGINDAGQIVVRAVNDPRYNPGTYRWRGLLLTPVPEPAALGLLVFASPALLRRRGPRSPRKNPERRGK